MQKSFQGLVPQPPYPWLAKEWQRFVSRCHDAQVPHALLLSGKGGCGELDLAFAMAQYLLCGSPKDVVSCGNCKSCLLIQSDAHPDLKFVTPEEKSTAIKIEAIRNIGAFVANTAQQGGRKVVIISPAESMNANAANALLKNLEEPSGDTTFILLSSNPLFLMATIRSRCLHWKLPSPSFEQSLAWLERNQVDEPEKRLATAGGQPLKVLEWLDQGLFDQAEAFNTLLEGVLEGRMDFMAGQFIRPR